MELNTDFLSSTMDPAMLRELSAAYLAGALDWESYVQKLKQGELVAPDADPEELRERIQSRPPGLSALMPEPQPAAA